MYSVAVTWSPSGTALYVNGAKEASSTTPPALDFGTTAYIGRYHLSTGFECNGLIDNLRISNKARSDAEIAALYNSGAPATADANTTLLLPFDGPDAQRAAKTVVI